MMQSVRNTDQMSRKKDAYQNRMPQTRWKSRNNYHYNNNKRYSSHFNAGAQGRQDSNTHNFNAPSRNHIYIRSPEHEPSETFDKSSNINIPGPGPNGQPGNASPSVPCSSHILQTTSTSDMPSSSVSHNINENNQNVGQSIEQEREANKITILELIKEVCSELGADESNIADRFFRALVSTLLSLTDSCPEQKSFVYKIMSAVVNVGLSYAQNPDDVEPEGPESIKNKGITSSNSLRNLQSLIEIDLLMQALMKHKLDLYNNVRQEIIKQQQTHRTSSKEPQHAIDGPAIQTGILKIENGILETNASLNECKGNMVLPAEIMKDSESQVNHTCSSMESLIPVGSNEDSLVTDSFLRLPCRTDHSSSTNNLDRPSSLQKGDQVCISYGALQHTEITCFCLYDKAVLTGYQNGTLRIFNLESGALLDNVLPHKKAVTSIHVWQNTVITTSLDGTMKLFDLAHHTSKMVVVEQEILTSCLFKGIIYLGTKSGCIFRLLVKNMKQIENPFCVCMKSVNKILVVEEKGIVLMFIAVEDASVCIRDGITGSLIQVFSQLPNASCIALLGQMTSTTRICAGFKDKMLALGLLSTTTPIMKMHSVTCMVLHRGILFTATYDHKILMYIEKTLELLNAPLEVSGEIKTMAVWGKFLMAATSTSGITYLDIPKIVIDRWSDLEGS